jgi:hypothetical protein
MTLTKPPKVNEKGEEVSEVIKQLCLNEVFIAEHDVASASRYRLVPDN